MKRALMVAVVVVILAGGYAALWPVYNQALDAQFKADLAAVR